MPGATPFKRTAENYNREQVSTGLWSLMERMGLPDNPILNARMTEAVLEVIRPSMTDVFDAIAEDVMRTTNRSVHEIMTEEDWKRHREAYKRFWSSDELTKKEGTIK